MHVLENVKNCNFARKALFVNGLFVYHTGTILNHWPVFSSSLDYSFEGEGGGEDCFTQTELSPQRAVPRI